MLKYLEKYKYTSFDELELNEIDLAIFTLLSYCHFEIANKSTLKLKEALSLEYLVNFNYMDDSSLKKLVILLKDSTRYDDIILVDTCYKTNNKDYKLSAITLRYNSSFFTIFMGSDFSGACWLENTSMLYKDIVASERVGKSYLEEIMKRYPDGNFYIMGHSKGARTAIVSSLLLRKNKRIKGIVAFDGPGINENSFDPDKLRYIKSKVLNYKPSNTFVGAILDTIGRTYYVKTNAKVGLSHNLFTWKVKDDHFVKTDESIKSIALTKTCSKVLATTSDEMLARIVSIANQLIDINNIHISTEWIANLKALRKTFSSLDKLYPEDREFLNRLINKIRKTYSREYKKALKRRYLK